MAEYIHATIPMGDISADELKAFLSLAQASLSHGGKPPISGPEPAQLSGLKRAGLLATVKESNGDQTVLFTGAGRCFASDHGIHIPG